LVANAAYLDNNFRVVQTLRLHRRGRVAPERRSMTTILVLNGPPLRSWKVLAQPALALFAGALIAVSLIVAIPRFGSYRPDYQVRALLLTPVSLVAAILLYRNHAWTLAAMCAFSALFALGMIAWRKAWPDRVIRAIRRRFTRD